MKRLFALFFILSIFYSGAILASKGNPEPEPETPEPESTEQNR